MKVVVVGAGKLGTSLTKALCGGGNEITVIDTNSAVISRIKDSFDVMTIQRDARNTETLSSMGIKNYDAIICCTQDDEKNIFIASMAKKLGCRYAVARVRDPEHVTQMHLIKDSFHLDYLANSDYACAKEMFKYLTDRSGKLGKHFVIDKTEIFELEISQIPGLTGKALKEASASLNGLLLTAISRSGRIVIPNGNTVLEEGDHLFLAGLSDKVEEFRKNLRKSIKTDKLRRVMIAGGGKTSFFLAKMFEDTSVGVKIIELSKDRCEYLTERLSKALILNGNASDTDIWDDEGIDHCDAFVATTDSDERNLAIGVMAQHREVKDVICKISSSYYGSLTDTIKDLMVMNPVDMCTTDILRRITNDVNVTFSKMVQGQAEFIEVTAKEGMPLTGGDLREINIPDGVLIASVTRGEDVVIPTGATRILPGDKVVILSLLTKVGERESLIALPDHN